MNPKIKKLLDELERTVANTYANYARGYLTDSEVLEQLRHIGIKLENDIDMAISEKSKPVYRRLLP